MKTSLYISTLLCALLLTACGSSGSSEADTDGDGVVDSQDAFPQDAKESKDTDSDGVGDNSDNCPTDANTHQTNTDANFDNGDDLGDACDKDDDADGVLDIDDAFDLDPTETVDSDTDLIGDNKDLDIGNNNPAAAQLVRIFETDRATLFVGAEGQDKAGLMVTNAGDINGDGKDDLAVGVRYSTLGGGIKAGAVYIFFGSATPWPTEIDLLDVPDQVEYVVIVGLNSYDSSNNLGSGITMLGDVNGDGISDLLVGGSRYYLSSSISDSGEAYLIFGRESWLADAGDDHIITMAELKSQYAITYQGQIQYGALGERVSAAGDVNGDRYNDFLISEYGYRGAVGPEYATGRVHLVFGGEELQPPAGDGSGVLNIDGSLPTARTVIVTDRIGSDPDREGVLDTLIGDEVLGAGNFDNDLNNYADIVVTSIDRNKVYVLFGQETWPAVINLPTIEAGKGFIFEAPSASSEVGIGQHIAAGDLNGDSIPELIISQPAQVDPEDDSDTPKAEGEVVILKGGVGNWPANLSLDNLGNFGSVWNTDEKLSLGSGLAVLPDNNNDGFGELLISAPQPDEADESLIFKVTADASLSPKTLNSTTTDAGVEIIRSLSSDIAGKNMRTLGDHNGDGFNEFVIDIPEADALERTDNGLFYVIQGYSSLYPE